jgi:protein-S-isoprenylcysteine O-methyltransferase Ste14
VTELLEALGWKAGPLGRLRLIALVACATLAALAVGTALAEVSGISIAVVQTILWVVWLAWLGVFFPHNALRDASRPCALPYRRAFKREIVIGIALAFSQLLRPFAIGLLDNGVAASGWLPAAAGIGLLVAGVVFIATGVATLGVARTLFVHEYGGADPGLTTNGIYRLVRHPLFLGGMLVSLGLAICAGERIALELALINVCVLPAYSRLEDQRCCTILGLPYARYRLSVGGMLPRRRSSIDSSARWRQERESIQPIRGRSLVRKR